MSDTSSEQLVGALQTEVTDLRGVVAELRRDGDAPGGGVDMFKSEMSTSYYAAVQRALVAENSTSPSGIGASPVRLALHTALVSFLIFITLVGLYSAKGAMALQVCRYRRARKGRLRDPKLPRPSRHTDFIQRLCRRRRSGRVGRRPRDGQLGQLRLLLLHAVPVHLRPDHPRLSPDRVHRRALHGRRLALARGEDQERAPHGIISSHLAAVRTPGFSEVKRTIALGFSEVKRTIHLLLCDDFVLLYDDLTAIFVLDR